jgi:uncharacterized protein YdaU (DUF1376 family)
MNATNKRKAPAFQFYADDFLAGTADMKAEEVGGFIRLLCHQWTKGGIPDDKDRAEMMAGLIGSPSICYVLAKFEKDPVDGLLKNKRLEIVRQEQQEFSKSRSTSGRKGAEIRWGHGKHDGKHDGSAIAQPMAEGMAEPMANAWQNDSSPSPSPYNTLNHTGSDEDPEVETLRLRIGSWFKRRPTTQWSEKEIRALKAVLKLNTPPEDIDALERWYLSGDKYLRKDPITLLNNWNGEIDKARQKTGTPQLFQRHAPDTSKYTAEQIALMEAMG